MRKMVLVMLAVLVGSLVWADESQWSIDKPVNTIPDMPITGRVFGKEFKLASATIDKVGVTLSSTGEQWPDAELMIFIGTDKLRDEVVVTPASEQDVPHVHMKFTRPGKRFPSTLMYTQEYSMRLTVVSRTDSEIKARIHISLPDYQKSYLIGTFTAKVTQ